MTTLSPKQQRFVEEYLVDCNGARAALAAGYGPAGARVAAHRLLTNANVRAAIEAWQGVDATRLGIERQDVISGLLEAFQMAKDGGNPAAMVAASRELGRLLGFYAPERRAIEVSPAGPRPRQRWEAMTDEQLAQIASGTVVLD